MNITNGSQQLEKDDDIIEQVYVWRMYIPGTDLRSFVVACTELEANFALSQKLPNTAGKWQLEDVVALDNVPMVVCIASNVQLKPVGISTH